MKFCSQCGMQMTDEALFCTGCGRRFEAPPPVAPASVVEAPMAVATPAAPVAPAGPVTPAPVASVEQPQSAVAPAYAPPAYPGPMMPPPPKSSTGKVVAIVVAIAVALAAIGVSLWLFVFNDDEGDGQGSTSQTDTGTTGTTGVPGGNTPGSGTPVPLPGGDTDGGSGDHSTGTTGIPGGNTPGSGVPVPLPGGNSSSALSDADKLVGQWAVYKRAASVVEMAVPDYGELEGYLDLSSLQMAVLYTFNADGSMAVTGDAAEAYEQYEDLFTDAAEALIADRAAEAGRTAMEYLSDKGYAHMLDFVTKKLAELGVTQATFQATADRLEEDGAVSYTISGDKITLGQNTFTFTFTDDDTVVWTKPGLTETLIRRR